MAELIKLPKKALESIARQIGARLYDEIYRREDGGKLKSFEFEMWETFEIWQFRPDPPSDLTQTREDLVTLARRTGVWHHQIKAGVGGGPKKAVAFAQSWPGSGQGDDLLRDLFLSQLAAKIDEAITLADNWLPDKAIVRLLSLPEYKVEALWFLSASDDVESPHPTSRVILVDVPDSFPTRSGESAMSPMSSSDFIRALGRTRRGMGLLF